MGGRGYRVLVLGAGTDAFDMLATETVVSADTVRPAAALLEAAGPRMGLAGEERLSGPTVDAGLAAFRAAFAGAPHEGALAALRRFDHGSVYGDALYRVAIPGFAEANRMDADLDMNGHAIEGAGRIEAARLEVETDLEAGGSLAVTGDLVVGRAVRAAGILRVAKHISGLVEESRRRTGGQSEENLDERAGSTETRREGVEKEPDDEEPAGPAAELTQALRVQRKDFGRWIDAERRIRKRWAGLAMAAGFPAALLLGVLVEQQFQVVPLHDPTGGWSGHVWDSYGRTIVDCAVEAMRTDAEVECPLVVRRP